MGVRGFESGGTEPTQAGDTQRRTGSRATAPAVTTAFAGEILRLQRNAGNAATSRLMRRLLARDDSAALLTDLSDPNPSSQEGPDEWSTDDLKAVQAQLKGLRLYLVRVDGINGPRTEQALTEAFGGEQWQLMSAADVLNALSGATRPSAGAGHMLRYGALFEDGVLDVTFAVGYLEGNEAGMRELTTTVGSDLVANGFTQDAQAAATVLQNAGRTVDPNDGVSEFYVLPQAIAYQAPAGQPIAVDAVVRVVSDIDGTNGPAARAAFEQAIMFGDLAYYHGHARYGTGPDFDANYNGFDLYDSNGNLEQHIDGYKALEKALGANGGDPWTVFTQRVNDGTLIVNLNNGGNVYLNDHNAHANDPEEGFGSRLMYWALAQDRTLETGSGNLLSSAAAKEYRVLVFQGCSTQDFDKALRATPGLDTMGADVIETKRVIYLVGGGAASFSAFLDDVMSQTSAEQVLTDMNSAMTAAYSATDPEGGEYKGPLAQGTPFKWSGISDNPSM